MKSLTLMLSLVVGLERICAAEDAGGGLWVGDQAIRTIVVPSSPLENELKAAETLKRYLEKMTGVVLTQAPLSSETRAKEGTIFLGAAAVEAGGFTKEEMAGAGLEGYRIRVKNGNVFIAGGKYYGTFYGTCHFLEQLGARFYAHDHEVIPPPAKIVVPPIEVVRRPVFEWRNSKFGDIRLGQQDQAVHAMVPKEIDPHLGIPVHWLHSSQYYVPFYRYGKEHPEYYARRADGSLDAQGLEKGNEKLHLCMSNPEVRKIAKQRLLEAMEKQPERRLFAVGQSDGYGWCECAGCRALDSAPGVRTDRLLDFVNDLARSVRDRYPDKIILTFAYCKDTAPPPQRLKPESNVRVILAPYTPEVQDKAHWFDHKLNRQFLPWYEGWIKGVAPGQLFIFDYPYTDFRSLSLLHEHYFWRIKRYAQDGVRGIYFDATDRFMYSLFEYVFSRLMWDPSLDPRPLVAEFIRSYYGPAAPAMQEIYDTLAKIAALDERSQGPTLDMRKFVTSEECQTLFKRFAKAEELAKDNAPCLTRIREDKSFLLYTDLAKHNPVLGTAPDLAAFKNKLGELLALTLNGRTNNLFSRTLKDPNKARNWFWKTARLKITAAKVRDDPVVQQLLTAPQSVSIAPVSPKERVELLPEAKGWRLLLELSEGAKHLDRYQYECPVRENVQLLNTRFTENSLLRFQFDLPEAPGAAALAIEGQDDDQSGATRIRIALNQRELFQGPNQFPEKNWGTCRYAIPEGTLQAGKNELVIEDLEEGENVFAQWVIVAEARIETTRTVKAPPSKTLLLVHFDKDFNADVGANPEARTSGDVRLHADGKWGGALDADYTELKDWSLRYEAVDHYQPAQGTVEMWVKPRWSPDDQVYSIFFWAVHEHNSNRGLMLFKYTEKPSLLFLCRDPGGGSARSTRLEWPPETWHHLAATWDAVKGRIQIFVDGVMAGQTTGLHWEADLADNLYVGGMRNGRNKSAKALIDELRITDRVRWEGETVGEQVFNVPVKPYAKSD